jgi:hypothetical protein
LIISSRRFHIKNQDTMNTYIEALPKAGLLE